MESPNDLKNKTLKRGRKVVFLSQKNVLFVTEITFDNNEIVTFNRLIDRTNCSWRQMAKHLIPVTGAVEKKAEWIG